MYKLILVLLKLNARGQQDVIDKVNEIIDELNKKAEKNKINK